MEFRSAAETETNSSFEIPDIEAIYKVLFYRGSERKKTLIRMCECTGGSVPFFSPCTKRSFLHYELHILNIFRCYFVLAPTEHPATFSHTNLKVVVFGLYLIIMVLHTSPLYGWGEYSFHRGKYYHRSCDDTPYNLNGDVTKRCSTAR